MKRLLVLFLVSILPTLHAWNSDVHQLINELAWLEMPKETQKQALALVLYFEEYSGAKGYNKFRHVGDLADNMLISKRDENKMTRFAPKWHYADLKVDYRDNSLSNELPEPPHIAWAVAESYAILQQSQSQFERAFHLILLSHWVGDIHQPLHAVSLFSDDFPQGDRGGNSFTIKLPAAYPSTSNLHALWDRAIYRWPLPIAERKIPGIARELRDRLDANEQRLRKQCQHLDPIDWLYEGQAMSTDFVYHTIQPNTELSIDYLETAQEKAFDQIALAGCRLGKMLNEVIGSKPT